MLPKYTIDIDFSDISFIVFLTDTDPDFNS